jgi:hypothetical protein
MEHSKFTNDGSLLEFLNQNGIPAIPSSKADSGMLHWWEFEKIARITDVAIFEGYFFLAITEQGFSLHVYNGRSDWYNYVRVWKSDVTETDFLQDLKSTIFSDDIYSFDSHVWHCVRETYFEFEWQRETNGIQNGEQISPELKLYIFNFHEGLVKTLSPKVVKQTTLDLLVLLTQDNLRNSANNLVMQKYFPPLKYERWNLSDEFKVLLQEIGESFQGNKIPTTKELDSLIKKVKDLRV